MAEYIFDPTPTRFRGIWFIVEGTDFTYEDTPDGPIPVSGTVTSISFLSAVGPDGDHYDIVLDEFAVTVADMATLNATWYSAYSLGTILDVVKALDGITFHDEVQQLSFSGGVFDDTVITGPGNDRLSGNAGNDVLRAGAGNDWLNGDLGDDRLIGNDGRDSLFGYDGNDFISGGAGDDYAQGDAGDDTISGGGGNDSLFGGSGHDEINGGSGDDALFGEAGDDKISGGGGNDNLLGGTGNDKLSAGGGSDRLYGGEGDDRLNGDAGDDFLSGSAGYDIMQGGAGADTFMFVAWEGMGTARIQDFNLAEDKLFIDLGVVMDATETWQSFVDHSVAKGSDTLYTGPDGMVILLRGVTPDMLGADNFLPSDFVVVQTSG